MARSSKLDPVDRYRFKVLVIEDIFSSQGANLIAAIKGEQTTQIGAGFSEVILPRADVGEIPYRENLHPNRFTKKPGLTRYEPITLRKGVTTDRSLYNWFKKVNNDAIGYSITAQIVGAFQVPPSYPDSFRKDLLISCLDRNGKAVKSWVILDAFPVSYKPGNDFDSTANEKLVQEISISFEAMVEITGEDLTILTSEADDAAAQASVTAALGLAIGGSGGGIF